VAKQFGYGSINELEPAQFWFECAMIGTCKPLFDNCANNYEVEEKLRKAGVITTDTDSESCALVVLFNSMGDGEAFIDRLNAYLLRKEDAMERAKEL
jgi:hypothetical protein